MARLPDPDNIHWVGQNNSFSWQAGYLMFAMEKMWRSTGDPAYFNYIKKYVDLHVDDQGNVPRSKLAAAIRWIVSRKVPAPIGNDSTTCGSRDFDIRRGAFINHAALGSPASIRPIAQVLMFGGNYGIARVVGMEI